MKTSIESSKKKPQVSIVTPFLNAEKFIQEAIESVIAQTYSNWELLLVDDGSSDGSTAIAQNYAARYPAKIHYLEHAGHQNLGKSSSRNLGIQHAKGDYLVFLDADDVLLPDKLERQVAILEAQPSAAMVYGTTLYWYGWTGRLQDIRHDFISKLGVQPGTLFQPPMLLTRFLQDGGIVPCLCALLVRRQVVEAIGGYDETIQHMYEDQVYIAKLCLNSAIFVESECGEKYRQHPDSSSYIAIKNGEYHPCRPNPARLNYLNWLATYIRQQGIEDAVLHRTVCRELWLYQHPLLYRLVNPAQYWLMLIKGYLGSIQTKLFQ